MKNPRQTHPTVLNGSDDLNDHLSLESAAVEESTEHNSVSVPQLAVAEPLAPLDVAWLLWAKRSWLSKIAFWGLVLSTLVAFVIPKRYKATIRLMPPDYHTGVSLAAFPALSQATGGKEGGGSSAMSIANQLLGLNTSGDLLIGVLRSRTVEDRVIKRFQLMNLYREKYPEDTRRKLESRTEIEPEKKTGIIAISVEDHLPARAAAMSQAYVEELNDLLAKVNTSAAHRERVFVEGRLNEIGKDLSTAEKEFSEFASQNNAIDVPQQAKAIVEGAARLEGQLMAAESQLQGLEQIYTPQNIRVRQLRAQIAELLRQRDKLSGKGVDLVTGGTLGSDQSYPSMRQLPLLGVKYLDLYRKNKVNEAVFELLTKQYEMAKIQEAKDVPSVQILDAVEVPQKKSFPHRLWIMLGGMCLSFMLGTIWVVGSELWARADRENAWKALASEVFFTVKSRTWNTKTAQKIHRVVAIPIYRMRDRIESLRRERSA
jgi:capsule polysaccharide export protein KpsE/RkpR